MKIERLLSIVILLVNRRLIQAKELADMFEVSVRTIYRDIDTINRAGIPVVTYQGAGGGIGLMEGYRLDRSLLTESELAHIFIALRSVGTYGSESQTMLMEKISSIIPPSQSAEFRSRTSRLAIDLSPWGADGRLRSKLRLLEEALEDSVTVTFAYAGSSGCSGVRTVEPHTLVFKGQSWYLYGYCTLRGDFRLFKLLRMKELVKNSKPFARREIRPDERPWDSGWQESFPPTALKLRFRADGRQLAEERFDAGELTENAEGGYDVILYYPEDSWLYGFLLGLGPSAEVLEPVHIRQRLGRLAAEIAEKYANRPCET